MATEIGMPLMAPPKDVQDSAMLSLHSHTKDRIGLGMTFLRRFWLLWRVGFPGIFSMMTLRFFIIAALTAGAAVGFAYLTQLSAPFVKAILQVDGAGIMRIFLIALGASIGIVLALVVAQYMGELLRLDWRRRLVQNVHHHYFSGKMMYWVNVLDGKIDNTDQRMTQDIEQFTLLAGGMIFGNFNGVQSVIYVVTAAVVNSVFTAQQLNAFAGLMSGTYALAGMVITTLLLIPVSRATFKTNETEGDFRFQHARVKEFAECIAFYDGQPQEEVKAERTFERLYKRFNVLFIRQFFLKFFTYLQQTLVGTFAMLLVTIIIVQNDGTVDGHPRTAETVQQAETSIVQLVGALSSIPVYYAQLGTLAGFTHRVGQVFEAIMHLEDAAEEIDQRGLGGDMKQSKNIAAVEVLCRNPDGRTLLSSLTFRLAHPEGMLIMGPSGAGKSSILRVIGGLWPFDAGTIEKPSVVGQGGIFFVPQRPYISQGTLREQLLYPHREAEQKCDDETLETLLRELGLGHLLSRSGGLDATENWADSLSGGEQQRMGFARLFYHRPRFAILDESTSALPVDLEARCMQLCRSKGIGCVSVGHRPTLIKYHEHILQLDGQGGYMMRRVSDEDMQACEEAFANEDDTFAAPERGAEASHDDALMLIDDNRDRRSRRGSATELSVDLDAQAPGNAVGGLGLRATNVGIDEATSEPYNPWSASVFRAPKDGNDEYSDDEADPLLNVAKGKDAPLNAAEESQSHVTFDMVFVRRFWRLFRLGFPKLLCKPTMVLLIACGLNALVAVVGVVTAQLPGIVMQDITDGDYHAAALEMVAVSVAFTVTSLFNAGCIWLGQKLQLYWYRALQREIQKVYFKNKVVYAANTMVPTLDNCDQRIVTDTRMLTQSFGAIAFATAQLPSIMQTITVVCISTYFSAQYGWITCVGNYSYALLGIIGTHFLMKPLIPLTYLRNMREGDFRFAHARLREFAESITFFEGQNAEGEFAGDRFGNLYQVYRKYINKNFPVRTLNNFQTIFGAVASVVIFGLGVAATGGVNGEPPTVSIVITAITMGSLLMSNLVLLPKYFTSMADVVGYTHRVGQMLDKASDVLSTYEWFDEQRMIRDGPSIKVQNVTCRTPGGEVLFRNLSFEVNEGESTVIMGPSGCGKSSLLRLIGGLWPFENGVIERPTTIGEGGLFFVPQRPYISDTTLREQLVYPDEESKVGDAELAGLLEQVDLGHLLTRFDGGLDATCRWADQLSGGEQQRIGFIRLLYHKPKFAFMDESTSALDVALEARCMELCQERGITYVSVGHRPTLIKWHQRILRLDGSGGSTMEAVGE